MHLLGQVRKVLLHERPRDVPVEDSYPVLRFIQFFAIFMIISRPHFP